MLSFERKVRRLIENDTINAHHSAVNAPISRKDADNREVVIVMELEKVLLVKDVCSIVAHYLQPVPWKLEVEGFRRCFWDRFSVYFLVYSKRNGVSGVSEGTVLGRRYSHGRTPELDPTKGKYPRFRASYDSVTGGVRWEHQDAPYLAFLPEHMEYC